MSETLTAKPVVSREDVARVVADAPAAEKKPEEPKKDSSFVDFMRRHGRGRSQEPTNFVKQDYEPVKLNRGELLHGATTESGREVTIQPEIVKEYSNFLDTYVRNLGKLAEQPAPAGSGKNTMLEYVTEDPKRQYDKLLIEMLGDKKNGPDGKLITASINADAMKNFLQKEDNWAMTTMLMEQHALMTDLGLGMNEVVSKSIADKKDKDIADDQSIDILKLPNPYQLGKKAVLTTGKFAAAAALFLGGRGSVRTDFTSDLDILHELKIRATDADKAYMRTMIGLDIDKFNIYAGPGRFGGPVRMQVRYEDGYKPDISGMRQKNVDIAKARTGFFTELGIDINKVRAADEHIFDNDAESEGLPLRYYQEVMSEYGRIGGGVDKFSLLDKKLRARAKVMTRYAERQLALVKVDEEDKSIASLETKAKAMREKPGELRAEQVKKHGEEKKKAEEKKTEAETKQALVAPAKEAADKVKALEVGLAAEFNVDPKDDITEALTKEKTKFQGEITTAKTEITRLEGLQAADTQTFLNELLVKKKEIMDAAAAALASSGAKGSITEPKFDMERELFKQQMELKYGNQITEQKAEIAKNQTKFDALETKLQDYEKAKTKRLESSLSLVGQERDQLQSSADAYDKFVGPPVILTDAKLQTLTVAEIAKKLRRGTDEEKLKLALLAKSESTAKQLETRNPLPQYQQDALTTLTSAVGGTPPGAGILIDDLFRDERTLQTDVMAAISGTSAEDARRLVRAAREAAEHKLRDRFQLRTEYEVKHYEAVIKDLDKKLEKTADFKDEQAHIELAVTLMKSQGDIYTRGYDVTGTPDEAKFYDMTPVDPTDQTLSEAERTSGMEKWYIHLFQFLQPEAVNSTNRENLFKTFQKVLPEAQVTALRSSSGGTLNLIGQLKEIINYTKDSALAL